jgi:hypothetical protein
MARQLGRHRPTIYREIKRNTFLDREMPDHDGYYTARLPTVSPGSGVAVGSWLTSQYSNSGDRI